MTPRSTDRPGPTSFERVYEVVRRVPRGRVATYGQIAVLAETGSPRVVGFALAALADADDERDVPWHRILNAKGEISLGRRDGAADEQRARLEDEGVAFDDRGRVSLSDVRWSRGV